MGALPRSSTPSTPIIAMESPRNAAPTMRTARRTTRDNEAGGKAWARFAEASQPVSTQTSRNDAGTSAAHPCGATGVKLPPSRCGYGDHHRHEHHQQELPGESHLCRRGSAQSRTV